LAAAVVVLVAGEHPADGNATIETYA